jgi:hypothetical protein
VAPRAIADGNRADQRNRLDISTLGESRRDRIGGSAKSSLPFEKSVFRGDGGFARSAPHVPPGYTSRPKDRLFAKRSAGWYLNDFARSRHTNPARIPVIVNADWYYTARPWLTCAFVVKVMRTIRQQFRLI